MKTLHFSCHFIKICVTQFFFYHVKWEVVCAICPTVKPITALKLIDANPLHGTSLPNLVGP